MTRNIGKIQFGCIRFSRERKSPKWEASTMPRRSASREFSNGQRHGRRSGFSVLALRQGSDDHPMAMFFLIVAMAFAAAALIPQSGAAFASFGTRSLEPASAKTSRLAASETDIACRGQAWGAESEACLAVIARESGKGEDLRIRLVAAAYPGPTTPNVFQ
jgi:hypothetical protein